MPTQSNGATASEPGNRRRDTLTYLTVIGLLALMTFGGLPPWPRFYVILNDAAHAPVSGVLAFFAWTLLGRHSAFTPAIRASLAFSATLGCGLAVEVTQGLIGRDFEWKDLATDALGALAALGFIAWRRLRCTPQSQLQAFRHIALAVALLAAAVVGLPVAEVALAYRARAQHFPALLQPGEPRDLYFVAGSGARYVVGALPHTFQAIEGESGFRLELGDGPWPGLALTEPEPDWTGFRVLNFDIINPGTESLTLTIRVHDRAHNQEQFDRFNRSFEVPAQTRKVLAIPTSDIQRGPINRDLDLGNVAGLAIFSSGHHDPGAIFYLARVWLD